MIDVLYYYYYIFYKKSKVETQPHLTTVWVLSFCLTWMIIVPIEIFLTYVFRVNIINKWIYLGLFCAIFLVIYWHFIWKKKGVKIINEKPMLLGNNTLSVIFVIIFTILPLILMFIRVTWVKTFLNSL